MFYIKEESFNRIMAKAERVHTSDPWGMRERLREYPVIRYWDSGEAIGASSGQWEEQARLIDTLSGELVVEVQEVYHGERFGNKAPLFFRAARQAYEAELAKAEAEA